MCESHDQMQWVENTRGKRDEVVFDEVSWTLTEGHSIGTVDLVQSLRVELNLCLGRAASPWEYPSSRHFVSRRLAAPMQAKRCGHRSLSTVSEPPRCEVEAES